MKVLVFCLLAGISSLSFAFDHDHKKWDQVLSKYLDHQAFVKYKTLKEDIKDGQHPFNHYLADLSAVSEASYNKWNRTEKMAFLINSYNAFTVKLILDNYPVDSIRDIGGLFTKPWSLKFFTLLGKKMSLDPIEHEILRPVFKDYRIHAAVNCASISCPVLAKKAFTSSNLDALLDEQMSLWLNDSSRNKVSPDGNWELSKIFDWYEDDFVNWGGGVDKVVRKYHKDAKGYQTKKLDIDHLKYDWNLNEAKKGAS